MPYTTTQTRLGPGFTPKAIKALILITCIATIVSALLEPLFRQWLQLPGPQSLLTLSWWGLSHWCLWQPFTYLFVHGAPGWGISFNLLIEVAFHMYLLWAMGSTVMEKVGTKPFLRLYFLAGVIAAALALTMMSLMGRAPILEGSTPAIMAMLLVWTMLFPEAEVLLFFLIPIKAKWLMVTVLGAVFLVDLSSGDLIGLASFFGGVITGYLYGVIAWELRSPFAFTHPFDHKLACQGLKWRQKLKKLQQKGGEYAGHPSKIFDIKSGKALDNDERFVDAMLDKISKHGESSLSWRERHRLNKISKRKGKKEDS